MDRGRVALVALLLCGVVAVVAGTVWEARAPDGARAASSGPVEAAAERPPERAVLARWQRARSAAWARGSVRELRRLYIPGSAVGRRDVRLLRRYADRGLRVGGLRTQVLAWSLVAHRPDRLVLRVTDRLVGGVAARDDGSSRARLPADRPTERRLTLVRREGRWLMARAT